MHSWRRVGVIVFGLAGLVFLLAPLTQAQWAASPGAMVRDAFGPSSGGSANTCRGACGGGCPQSCKRTTVFECVGESSFHRLVRYRCGTHAACRTHDDCLDACSLVSANADSQDCQSQCDAEVVQGFGAVAAAAWLSGQGPYDGHIVFEYSRESAQTPQPQYQCPKGTTRQCSGSVGCLAGNGVLYEPMFGQYQNAPKNAMQVSSFRTGLVCDDHVCTYAIDIPVTGADDCAGQRCTRFGVEFDYSRADPAAPLECKTSTTGASGDFVNNLLKLGGDAITSRNEHDATESQTSGNEDGAVGLAGLFGKIAASADSTEDLDVTITPLDKEGSPVEAQRFGSQPSEGPPPVPRTINLSASSGHLVIPMYQTLKGMTPGETKEKRVTCSHKDTPVLEAVFRLRAS